ncbi:MAG: hypothetical protein AAF802_27155 [Planctomycetota bacterium]
MVWIEMGQITSRLAMLVARLMQRPPKWSEPDGVSPRTTEVSAPRTKS